MTPWTILNMAASSDEREIKRAYARRLKTTRAEDDPAAFQELNDAFQAALRMAQYAQAAQAASDEEAGQERGYEPEPEPEPESEHGHEPEPAAAPELQAVPVQLGKPAGGGDTPAPPAVVIQFQTAAERALHNGAHAATARMLWSGFIANVGGQPRERLARISAGDDMLDMQVRDSFELCALAYCASPTCADELRAEIADYFGWENDPAFVGRHLPDQTHEVISRLRAHRSYGQFCELAQTNKPLKALLADRVERSFWRTTNRDFTQAMREWIDVIRSHHPEMLEYKLDRTVFWDWARRVAGKRYFYQTAVGSAITGLLLSFLAWSVLAQFALHERYATPIAAAIFALSFGLFGWFAFHPAEGVQGYVPATWRERVDTLLHVHRYRPLVQYGWLAPFALASLCLFIPEPSAATKIAVGAAMLACLLGASFANSAVLPPMSFFVAGAAGVLFALNVAAGGPFHATTYALAAMCALQVLYRGGADLFDYLEVPAATVLSARIGWLSAAAAVFAFAHVAPVPPYVFAGAVWLLILAGMLLSRPSFFLLIGYVGALVVKSYVFKQLPRPSLLMVGPMPLLALGLIVVAIFMAVNMLRANKTQHQFS
ncbi:MAG: J domain-containing protein [Pseudomonadota bacterium]